MVDETYTPDELRKIADGPYQKGIIPDVLRYCASEIERLTQQVPKLSSPEDQSPIEPHKLVYLRDVAASEDEDRDFTLAENVPALLDEIERLTAVLTGILNDEIGGPEKRLIESLNETNQRQADEIKAPSEIVGANVVTGPTPVCTVVSGLCQKCGLRLAAKPMDGGCTCYGSFTERSAQTGAHD